MLRVAVIAAMLAFAVASRVATSGIFDTVPQDDWTYATVEQFDCDWLPFVFDHKPAPPMTRYAFGIFTAEVYQKLISSDQAKRKITPVQVSILIKLVDEFWEELTVLDFDIDIMKRGISSAPTYQDYPELADMAKDHWAYAPMRQMYELGFLFGDPQQ